SLFNGSASGDALSWERAASNYESRSSFRRAGDAWLNAASIWGPKVGNWQGEGQDADRAAADYLQSGSPTAAANAYGYVAGDFAQIGAWQMVAAAYDRQAAIYMQQKSYANAAAAW